MSFVEQILYHGKIHPEKPAIMLAKNSVTFKLLSSGIRSACAAFSEMGVDKLGVVAVKVDDPIIHMTISLALYRMGIVSISVNGKERPFNDVLTIAATITDRPGLSPQYGRQIPIKIDWFTKPTDINQEYTGFSSDQLSRITMSSGTTAVQKAVGHTAGAMDDRIAAGYRSLSGTAWDRMMCLTALHSSTGFGRMSQALSYGHTVVFADSAANALKMIATHNVDLLVANPRHLKALVDAHRILPIQLSSLKMVKYGGDSIAPDLAAEVKQRFCSNLLCVYSSTESGPMLYGPYDSDMIKSGSMGYLAPWVQADVLDKDGVVLPRGSRGMLRIRTPWQGYDLSIGPGAVEQGILTGDIAEISEDGMLSHFGRTADAIPVGSTYVIPVQIEDALYSYQGVDDCAAVGIDDNICLAIVADDTVDAEDVKQHLASINDLWDIAKVYKVNSIPRNDMGKILRKQVIGLCTEG